jgi:hypothetical protein
MAARILSGVVGGYSHTGDLTVDLRSERAGPQDGRVSTITVQCEDASGNVSDPAEAIVTVARDLGG